ncbi:MAG: rhomboid family intramembrane serine protease [Myxococcales bacterium]|nr:rhomboid family intramembrane serine protease [Myxococcales bacterium]
MRENYGQQMRLGSRGPSTVVAWVLALEVGCFLLYLFGGKATQATLVGALTASPARTLDQLHLWQLVTAPLLHLEGLSFFFNALMLWMFVPTLERWWGPRRFIKFLVATSITGTLASCLVGAWLAPVTVISGLTPFIYASIVAFGVLYANQPVQLFGVVPIKGRTLAIGVAGFLALFVLLERSWVSGAGSFSAMGLSWLMTSGAFTPNVWWLKWRRARLRRRYRVLDGGGARTDKRDDDRDDNRRSRMN